MTPDEVRRLARELARSIGRIRIAYAARDLNETIDGRSARERHTLAGGGFAAPEYTGGPARDIHIIKYLAERAGFEPAAGF
jgi:hypothetical protein